MCRLVIGIDPDLVKSGVAVVIDGDLTRLESMGFFDLVGFINENASTAQFVLEDVEHDKAVYIRPGQSRNQMLKIAQNVGQVKAIGRLLSGYLQAANADYVLVKPLQGSLKSAKKDAAYFNRITGWKGQSNEDKRDAALLALYGLTARQARLG